MPVIHYPGVLVVRIAVPRDRYTSVFQHLDYGHEGKREFNFLILIILFN